MRVCSLFCCVGLLLAVPAMGQVDLVVTGPAEVGQGGTITVEVWLDSPTAFTLRGMQISPACSATAIGGATGSLDYVAASSQIDALKSFDFAFNVCKNCMAATCQTQALDQGACPGSPPRVAYATTAAGQAPIVGGGSSYCVGYVPNPPDTGCGVACEDNSVCGIMGATCHEATYMASFNFAASGDAAGDFQICLNPPPLSYLRDEVSADIPYTGVCLDVRVVECTVDGDCDPDGDECTQDLCVAGICDYSTPTDCDDSDECTTDGCDAATGCTHDPVDCDDADECTTDTCDTELGCQYAAVDCDDEDACTTDTCDAEAGCQYDAVVCDDGVDCTDDTCDSGSGCVYTPNNGLCDDTDACTNDICDSELGCRYSAVDCDDSDACTTDTCDTELGCQYAAIDCDDFDACTTDTCDAELGCQYAAVDCDDSDACTTDTCDAELGCQYAAVDCDDFDACTTDTCDAEAGCEYAAVDCSDGIDCTDDTCDSEAGCINTPNHALCFDDQGCTEDICDPDLGCLNPLIPDCTEFPELCAVIDYTPRSGDDCYDLGSQIIVSIVKGEATGTFVVGGQFNVQYDHTSLALVDVLPAGHADCAPLGPFSATILAEPIPVDGGVFFEVDVGSNPPGIGTDGEAVMGCLVFDVIACDPKDEDICFCGKECNPYVTRLADGDGAIQFTPCEDGCADVVANTPIVVDIPDSVAVNSDCDATTATVTWDTPTASDECGALTGGCTCEVLAGELTDCSMFVNGGGVMPQGSYLFTCEWTEDQCGDIGGGTWTVDVSELATLVTEIQLSPMIEDVELTRCLEFNLYWSCTPLWVESVDLDITFGGAYNLPGHFAGEVKVPKGQFACIEVRDPVHTLRSCSTIECDGVNFHSLHKGDPFYPGGNWLIGGNLDGDMPQPFSPRTIDISDYGIFVGQFGTLVEANTGCDDAPNADINGDGQVDEEDFTFIAINFMATDKDCFCCPVREDGDVDGRTSISVRELLKAGHPEMTAADLNGDGWVDTADMDAFMAGVRPKTQRNTTGR